MKLHIVYTETAVLLSKKSYISWKEIQNDFSEYKASLGPWSIEEVTLYLDDEYPNIAESAATQISAFLISSDQVTGVKFDN